MKPLKFSLEVESGDRKRIETLLQKIPSLYRINYCVNNFTGESGETTTITFECMYGHNLMDVSKLVCGTFEDCSDCGSRGGSCGCTPEATKSDSPVRNSHEEKADNPPVKTLGEELILAEKALIDYITVSSRIKPIKSAINKLLDIKGSCKCLSLGFDGCECPLCQIDRMDDERIIIEANGFIEKEKAVRGK